MIFSSPIPTLIFGAGRDAELSLNPFLKNILLKKPSRTGTSIPGNDFQNFLNYLQDRSGKTINARPFNKQFPQGDPNTLGIFFSTNPTGGLYNPPDKATQRDVFVVPGVSYETLAHEVGHARDPDLRMLGAKEVHKKQSVFNTPTEYLQDIFQKHIQPQVKAETEAQQWGAKAVRQYAGLNPNLQIDAAAYEKQPWFKGYPESYADKGIQSVYAQAIPFAQVSYPTDALDQPTTRVFVKQQGTPLGLALDPTFQQKQKEVQDWTSNYVNSMLNQF